MAAVLVAGVSLLAGGSALLAANGTANAQAASGTSRLHVVRCPTFIPLVPRPRPAVLPRSLPAAISPAVAASMSVYTDSQGTMRLVAPKGWGCAAFFGADGSGGVAVYPPGTALPRNWTTGWPLARTSSVTAVTGLETSACYTCTLGQACRLFPAARAALDSYLGHDACASRPAGETTRRIGAGVMGFQDPPGTAGDGVPSGGRYPAAGVMTYHPRASSGSWLETCTLPPGDRAACAAILGTFTTWYGQR